MAASKTSSNLVHRTSGLASESNPSPTENGPGRQDAKHTELNSEVMLQRTRHVEQIKAEVIEQVKAQMSEVLDKVLTDSLQSFSQSADSSAVENTHQKTAEKARRHRMEDGKVFVARKSILDELFEISHIRSIYHMFVAALFLFIISTLAVDYIDQGRLVLDFDLFFYAFGQLGTVIWAWLIMFSYTLLGPYYILRQWTEHHYQWKMLASIATAIVLLAAEMSVLGYFPVYVVLHYQLPPASRFIIILEQIRFLMKSYSYIRETVVAVLSTKSKKGEAASFPTLSNYLYFLFCPTLIYRETYPRNPYIRWNYVRRNFAMILGSLFYLYFILVRLCIPVYMNKSNQPFSRRTLVLAVFHSTLPGMLMLLLGFFAFLHCWLNAFAEMLRFADRMFYKDWWNSTSFANYYRTWNVVVHDWLYYYAYRDFLWLSGHRLRSVATMSVFAVSAFVHEYAFTMGFGFFYPVMFCLFAIIGVVFNFTLNDKRKSPVWNIIMWACLFIGQGVQVCLYCLEWYAQVHCPRTGTGFWELVTPRSWTCSYNI
ncbi:sterol O-acyltransferase 2 [Ictalurus furcatus]|uniref:sterol O-acyltransferase 2 n=1 Tax=Ictalurus furcatus TaxID=66913 RepID=UPI00234FC25A|nr:sterol O-acyltransferase 2 [Ictalurus furcatus]XP_053492902.1 sterol O-acyltransferase 2 [Ictalurus furcatus]